MRARRKRPLCTHWLAVYTTDSPDLATYFCLSFRFFKKDSCQLLAKVCVQVNRLGGLSLPRKSVVRLTDRPDMTLDVYRGRKTTMQHATSDSLNN